MLSNIYIFLNVELVTVLPQLSCFDDGVVLDVYKQDICLFITFQIPYHIKPLSACYQLQSDCSYSLVPASAGSPPLLPSPFFFVLSRTEEPAKAGICASDRRVLQQLALNVHVKHCDLTLFIAARWASCTSRLKS